MGIADSFGAGVNAINDMYRGQALHDQLQTYPDLLQAQLQQAQHTAGISGVQLQYAPQMAAADLQKSNLFNQYYGPTQQANIGLTNAQAGQASANAGYIGTEAQKNQFLINNPGLMVPGIGGQIAGIGYLQQHDPTMFQGAPSNAPVNTPAPIAAPFDPNGMTGLGGTPFSAQSSMPQPVQNQGVQIPPVSSPNMPQTAGLGGSMFGGNPLANRMLQSVFAPMNKDMSQAQYYNTRSAGFNQLPPDAKQQVISQTNAFGYSPEEAGALLSQGQTIQQLGAAKGYNDPNNYPPGQPSPTAANRAQTVLRNGALAELNAVQPWMTASLAPYSQRIAGYSPAQVGQAISGSDPEAQANFIAAKAITPDYNALRAKIMSGQFGIGMAEHLQDEAMNSFKAFEATTSPAVYARAQQIGEQKFNEMVNAANNSIYTAPATRAAQSKTSATNNPNSTIQSTKTLNGNTYVKMNEQWYQQ